MSSVDDQPELRRHPVAEEEPLEVTRRKAGGVSVYLVRSSDEVYNQAARLPAEAAARFAEFRVAPTPATACWST